MKLFLSALMCVLFSSVVIYAQDQQGKITGRVISSDGDGISNATIEIRETKKVFVTSKDGSFEAQLSAGNYTLSVRVIGSLMKETPVEVVAGKTTDAGNIKLSESSYELKNVVVTGQFEPQSLKKSVYQVRVIDQEKIAARSATNLQAILNTELGMRFSNDLTTGTTDIQLMGMAGRNVKILLDGVPLLDRGDTRESLNQIDVHSIEKIEIVEGPMSVVYGTDALAGVINVITKKGNANTLSAIVNLQEETAGNEYGIAGAGTHNQNLTVNWLRKGWNVSASGTRNDFGGWQGQSVGRVNDWKPKDQVLANGKVGYSNNNLNAWYRLSYLDENILSRGQLNPNNFRAQDQEYITDRFNHQAQAEWKVNSRFNVTASASYQDYKRRTYTTIWDAVAGTRQESTDQSVQALDKFKSTFFRGTAQYKLSDKVSFQPGLEINLDRATGTRITGSPVINDYAAFLSSEINLASFINIRPGVRFIKNSVYDAPPVIPSINTKFKLSKTLDLRMAYARGFRSPALRELYFSFHDASHDIDGNLNLKAENSNSYNTSLSWMALNTSALSIQSTAGGFYNVFKNMISTGQSANDPALFTYLNIDQSKTAGGTLDNKIHWKNLDASAGFSYIGRYNNISDAANNLPTLLWSTEINSNLTYRFQKIKTALSLFYKYTGKRPGYEIASSGDVQQVQISGFNWADLTANKSVGKYLILNAGVRNLFNITRVNNNSSDVGSAHSTGGPMPVSYGRSFFLGMQVQWLKQ